MGNPVVHFEIVGPDGPALQKFYQDLFGWNIDVQGEETGFYGLVHASEGGIGGGIMSATDDMPVSNYVSFYVQVDNLQAALDKAAGLGGFTCMPPMEIAPGMGSIAMFADPANNGIGIYEMPAEWDGEMPPKDDTPPVVHFEIGGKDAAALQSFYETMFDWKFHLHEEMNYRIIQQEDGDPMGGIGGGMFEHTDEMPPNAPSLGIMVDDLQAYLDKAVSLGATAMMQPSDIPGGFGAIAIFYDTAGNRITLFKPTADHA